MPEEEESREDCCCLDYVQYREMSYHCPGKEATHLGSQESVAVVLDPGDVNALHQPGQHVVQHEDGGLEVCALLQHRLTHFQCQLVVRETV